jgi:acyl carrier protein
MTAKVIAAWTEILNTPDIPPDTNFFEMGGHSLAMFDLQDALERHTGTRPPVVALFQHSTVAAQVALICDSGPDRDGSQHELQRAVAWQARARQARQARRQRLQQEATR